MLILTRCKGQTIYINDDVTVTVLDTNRHRVKLCIKAPKHIAIFREEVYWRKQQVEQNKQQNYIK